MSSLRWPATDSSSRPCYPFYHVLRDREGSTWSAARADRRSGEGTPLSSSRATARCASRRSEFRAIGGVGKSIPLSSPGRRRRPPPPSSSRAHERPIFQLRTHLRLTARFGASYFERSGCVAREPAEGAGLPVRRPPRRRARWKVGRVPQTLREASSLRQVRQVRHQHDELHPILAARALQHVQLQSLAIFTNRDSDSPCAYSMTTKSSSGPSLCQASRRSSETYHQPRVGSPLARLRR